LERPGARVTDLRRLAGWVDVQADVSDETVVRLQRDAELDPCTQPGAFHVPHGIDEGLRVADAHGRPALIAGNFGIAPVIVEMLQVVLGKRAQRYAWSLKRQWPVRERSPVTWLRGDSRFVGKGTAQVG